MEEEKKTTDVESGADLVEKKKRKKRHEVAYESVKIDTSVDKKKKKRKKRHEVAIDTSVDKKKKKRKKRHEVAYESVKKIDTSVDKKKKKKKRHEVAYESVKKIDTSVDKKKKKKKRHEVVNDVVSEHDVESETGALEVKKMKKKKKKRHEVVNDVVSEHDVESETGALEVKKMKKKKKRTHEVVNDVVSEHDVESETGALEVKKMKKKKKRTHEVYKDKNIRSDSMDDARSSDVGTDTKRKKKHRKTKESLTESLAECENNASKKKKHKDKLKKRKRNTLMTHRSLLKRASPNSEGAARYGMRYTLEEDAQIKKAVDDYIVVNGLASSDCVDKDLDANWKKARSMVMNCQKHPELRGCWKFISAAIPGRTSKGVYERAHFVYDSAAEEHKWWTKEENDKTLSFHEKKGPKWRELGDLLGKSRKHTRDAYRRNKLRDTRA